MTFTFFDANNNMIGTPVTANFASNFQTYFAKYTIGQLVSGGDLVSGPGRCVLVATVTVTLNNSAGADADGDAHIPVT